ncbi:hypothetical protein [Hydrogenivirga sp.]
MLKRVLYLCSLLLIGLFMVSCAQPPKLLKVEPPQYSPVFTVKKGQKAEKGLGLKVALLLPAGEVPNLKAESSQGMVSPLLVSFRRPTVKFVKGELPDNFKRNLARSMEAILLNKGYSVTGPYKSYDEMTYGEKKEVDFVLLPQIELYSEIVAQKCDTKRPFTGPAGISISKGEVKCEGAVRFAGQLSFVLLEPLTKEKVYIKGVDFKTREIPFSVVVEYAQHSAAGSAYQMAMQNMYAAIESAKNKALEEAYNQFLEMFEKYMPEGEEALALKKQVEELKKLKRF